MRKKQVAFYLFENEHKALKALSEKRGVSMNELITKNVKKLLAESK